MTKDNCQVTKDKVTHFFLTDKFCNFFDNQLTKYKVK